MNNRNIIITIAFVILFCNSFIYAENSISDYCPVFPGNILENPSFEDGSDVSATFWNKGSGGRYGHYSQTGQDKCYIAGNAHSGEKCLAIANAKTGLARWYSEDVYLMEGAEYRLSCWIKTEGGDVAGRIWFPVIGIDFTFEDTPEWVRVEKYFVASKSDQNILFLMSEGPGTVFFDDISLEMTKNPLKNMKAKIETGGKALTQIVIPDDCTMADYYSAFEARRVLNEMTGIELPVVIKSTLSSKIGSIYIGCAPDMNEYSGDLSSVGDEGIVLDINPDNIICLGNTTRGVYYAVQELFYVLGCRWYTPWDGGECIPKTSTINLPYKKIVHEPSFKLRGEAYTQGYFYPPDMDYQHVNTDSWWDFGARNRMNGLNGSWPVPWDAGAIRGHSSQDWAGHTIYRIISPGYFAEHPEYFPLIDGVRTYMTPWGKRPANICVSNQDVIKICADFAIDYFDTHPFAERFHIGQMDVGGQCECGLCLSLDPPGSVDWSTKKSGILVITDRWLWFINHVADIVKLSYPDRFVSTYSYAETHTTPINPANNPRDNVMIEYAWAETNFQGEWDIVRCYKHDMDNPACPNNVDGLQILNNWVNLAPISIYSYYLYYNNTGTAGSYYNHDTSFYRSLYDAGVRHINEEVGADPVSAPLLLNLRMRVLWDINTDVDKYVDDFCNSVYGPAAATVKQFFTDVEGTILNSTKSHVFFNDFEIFTPEIIAKLDSYLDSAETLVVGNTTLEARIARLRVSLIYTKIKTLQNTSQAIGIDLKAKEPQADIAAAKAKQIVALKADANILIKKYNIPLSPLVWAGLAP